MVIVDFTMSESVPSEKVLLVILSGYYNIQMQYTVSGTTLTFQPLLVQEKL